MSFKMMLRALRPNCIPHLRQEIGAQKNSYIRTGVSQVLSRLTYTSMISHFRRLMVPIEKEGKNVDLRKIHTSQFDIFVRLKLQKGNHLEQS